MTLKTYTVTDINGHTHVYCDESLTIKHNESGPALILKDGTKVWYRNGRIHRDDGPAIEDSTGLKSWYLNGRQLSQSEFYRQTNLN